MRGKLSMKDQALVLKFNCSHIGYRNHAFKINDTSVSSSDNSSFYASGTYFEEKKISLYTKGGGLNI